MGCGTQALAQQRANAAEAGAVSELVVTAQKREERLVDVPISITALSGEALDKAPSSGVMETLQRVPGVLIGFSTGGARSNRVDGITIRGVAPGVAAGTTGYYLDSIPFGFVRISQVPDSNAFDLERVEVLRGPQGTLYGASAMNGVVRVLTKDADPTRYEVKVRGSVATTAHGSESYRGDLAVNLPLIDDKLAARIVLGQQELAGWVDKPIEKDANDGTLRNFRLKVNARPSEALTFDALAWISRNSYGAHSTSIDNRTRASFHPESSRTDFDAFGLRAVYELPAFTVTSMTSHIDFRQRAFVDFSPITVLPGGAPDAWFFTANRSKVKAQEIVLNSNRDGAWRWSMGGFYRDAKEQLAQIRYNFVTGQLIGGYLAPTDQRTRSESFALFGEITRSFFDGRFEATAGLRYFEDQVTERELSRFNAPGGIPARGLQTAESKFDKLSSRFLITWHPSRDFTVYTSYGEGFRSGINQLPTVTELAPQFGPVKPDTLKSYEVGSKGSLWDGRVSFDAAVYYIKQQNVQQSLSVVIIPPNTQSSALVNSGEVSGPGIDLGLTAEVVPDLSVGLAFSWNDLEVQQDVLTGGRVLYPKGTRLLFSQEYNFGINASYSKPIGDDLEARIFVAANYIPSVLTGRTNPTAAAPISIPFYSDSIWQSQARLELASPKGWTASLFAENLFNEGDISARDPFTQIWNTHLRPRTVGIQLEYRY
jgi:iron complex outermembrane recepter protein